MRMTQGAIRGARPTTRFASPATDVRERHFGLRRVASVRMATPIARSAAVTPLAAIRQAARGCRGAATGADKLRRSDGVSWSQPSNGVPHRTRPRSAAPWRG
jgi:hypothetical protein